ncbi:aromatic acid exporter family protein [Weissella ceti]|uniref:Aromatic acid exporter family protein n=1 Tax=Weissella ceti TaxID=759620 RepID=A0ABT3E6N1_9LACO|nr:aromatic acid exporter family protein [Weissella ceti]MCW0953593.1 aromatic acid exporter family protein [Weissella ceti]QVK12187.1 FUSC family protein [Weissella ceti]
MTLGHFRFGMRTLKTGLSVMIIVIFFLVFHRGNPMIACLAAVFSLRQDFESTMNFGVSRVIASIIGGICSLIYFGIWNTSNQADWAQIVFIPLLLMVVIIINDGIGNTTGIIGASAAFLMIAFTLPVDGDMMYAVDRVIDTFLGLGAAILMNVGVHPNASPETHAQLSDVVRDAEAELKSDVKAFDNKNK